MDIIKHLVLFFLIFLFLPVFGQASSTTEELVLALGQSKNFTASSYSKVHIGDGKILKIIDHDSHIQVIPKTLGSSYLKIGLKKYKIIVVYETQLNFYKKLAEKIKNTLGLKLKIDKKRILVYGQLHRFEDWLNIKTISAFHPGALYYFQAEIDDDLKDRISIHFHNLLSSYQFEQPLLRYSPFFQISFSGSLKDQKKFINQLLEPYGVQAHFSNTHISIKPLIRVHIVIAEVSKKLSKQWGVSWNQDVKAQIIPEFINLSRVTPQIRALEENGLGKILASPNLLAKSGERAEFLAGGEFPIKVVGYNKVSRIIWKRHGILLNVKPIADSLGHLDLNLSVEISIIDHSQSVEGVPGLKTNRIKTHFNLKKPQTILLSGLIRKQWGKSAEQLPVLKSIPILGHLFSSNDYQNDETELLIFVTPEIIKPSQTSDSITPPIQKELQHEYNSTFQ